MLECTPIRKTQANSTGTLVVKKPKAAMPMMATSSSLTERMISALSYLSAHCPAVADSSTNGRMNSAPMTRPAIAGSSQLSCSW